MTPRLQQRRARIRAEYGFDFPDDFYRFWDFVNRLAPLDPLHALSETLGVTLVGPFEILAGRFDGRVPRHSLLLHWRYHDDPPEFFTVLAGPSDGLHWGFYLDDPDMHSGCVASYYAREEYELSADGDTLFEAMRLHLEYCQGDCEMDAQIEESPGQIAFHLEALDSMRRALTAFSTSDRPEIGEEYTERYAGVNSREARVTAATMDHMGVVVPPQCYRSLSLSGRPLWRQLRKKNHDPGKLVEEARQALAEGYPGTALALGKDLWATVGPRNTAYAVALLEAAYDALARNSLLRVLQTHIANRTLASVDILEEES